MADTLPKRKLPKHTQRDTKASTGYRFMDTDERDPDIDLVNQIVEESQLTNKQIEIKTGVTTKTLKRWQQGNVRWPNKKTQLFVLRACGYSLGIYKSSTGEVVNATPLQRRNWLKRVK